MSDRFQAAVDKIDDVHPEIRIIRLRPLGEAVAWKAGQFMEISFAENPPRLYSIANAPRGEALEFHIRNNNRGGASQYAIEFLKTGDVLDLRGPMGDAVLTPDNTHPLVMIAGGMGIPPMKAMIEDLLSRARETTLPDITLYWGVREESDLYLAAYFRALMLDCTHLRFIPVIESKGAGLVGAVVANNIPDFSSSRIYLAGPPAMVDATLPLLLEKGAHRALIHTDDEEARRFLLQNPEGPVSWRA